MTEKNRKTPHIVISDQEPGLPFSKGLLASQVMVTGLSPYRSYQVAEAVEERIRRDGLGMLTSEELSAIAIDVLTELAGESYAMNLARWREWMRYVNADQIWVWGLFCFFGMYLNVNLATAHKFDGLFGVLPNIGLPYFRLPVRKQHQARMIPVRAIQI